MMHNPALSFNLHTLFAKMMFGLADAILAKETGQGAARLLEAMFETCLERLEGLCVVYSEVSPALERNKQKSQINLTPSNYAELTSIEKSRPVAAAVYLIEKPEEVIHGMLFKSLLSLHLLKCNPFRLSKCLQNTSTRLSGLPYLFEKM